MCAETTPAGQELSSSGEAAAKPGASTGMTILLATIAVARGLLSRSRRSHRFETLKPVPPQAGGREFASGPEFPSGPKLQQSSRRESIGRESIGIQLRRAHEFNRGRGALSPLDIPWKGWKDILWRAAKRSSQDRLLAVAAGVVFYGLLALFPAIAALVSCYGLFASTASIDQHLSFLASVMPAEAYSIVQDQVMHVVAKGEARLSFGFVTGFVVALWSANAGVKALMDALNVVYQEEEKRSYLRLNLVSLTYTITGVGAMLIAMGVVVLVPLWLSKFGLAQFSETIVKIARWPALMVGMLLGLSLLYRHGPSRREAKWEWISVGAVFAPLTWFAGSAALSWYLADFANYDAMYGSLAAAIGTMMWLWMSAAVVLLGAELNAEIEHQTAMDSTVGTQKPLGSRGATMADTVGPAQVR
jgi:membrane protein